MLPASIYVMFHPAQHCPVHFFFRWHVEIVTGDQIQDLGRQDTADGQIYYDRNFKLLVLLIEL